MVNKIIAKTNISYKKINKLFIFANIFLFATYLFFVGATTVEVVARKNTEESVRALQSKRASIEEVYNEASKAYTKEYARNLGFVEAVPTFYATKTNSTVAYDGNKAF